MSNNLRIWGRMSSLNVRKVVWCAQELALDFQRTEVGGQFGVVKTPEYEALNPNALVPVIQDDGYVLWESNVIVRVTSAPNTAWARSTPPSCSPAGRRTLDGLATDHHEPGRARWFYPVGAHRTRTEGDADKYLVTVAATEPLLALLDAHLAQQPFMVGDSFTMADIPIACEIHRWRAPPLSDTAPVTPHLDR